MIWGKRIHSQSPLIVIKVQCSTFDRFLRSLCSFAAIFLPPIFSCPSVVTSSRTFPFSFTPASLPSGRFKHGIEISQHIIALRRGICAA